MKSKSTAVKFERITRNPKRHAVTWKNADGQMIGAEFALSVRDERELTAAARKHFDMTLEAFLTAFAFHNLPGQPKVPTLKEVRSAKCPEGWDNPWLVVHPEALTRINEAVAKYCAETVDNVLLHAALSDAEMQVEGYVFSPVDGSIIFGTPELEQHMTRSGRGDEWFAPIRPRDLSEGALAALKRLRKAAPALTLGTIATECFDSLLSDCADDSQLFATMLAHCKARG